MVSGKLFDQHATLHQLLVLKNKTYGLEKSLARCYSILLQQKQRNTEGNSPLKFANKINEPERLVLQKIFLPERKQNALFLNQTVQLLLLLTNNAITRINQTLQVLNTNNIVAAQLHTEFQGTGIPSGEINRKHPQKRHIHISPSKILTEDKISGVGTITVGTNQRSAIPVC